MALPHEHCVGVSVCCTSLFDVAANILTVAHEAVDNCSIVDCELPPIVPYISMGRQIEDPVADYLAVSLLSVTPSEQAANRTGGAMQLPIYRATFQVKLLETGWPQPQGDDEGVVWPNPDLVQNVSRHSYAHGEAMYRAIAGALSAGTLTPESCDFKRIEPMTPVEPSGGTTGWITQVVVGMSW